MEKLSASGDSPRPPVHRCLGKNKILATALTNFRSSKIRQFTSNYAQPICTSEGRRCNWPVACYSAFDGLRYNVVITTAVDMSVKQQMCRDDAFGVAFSAAVAAAAAAAAADDKPTRMCTASSEPACC